MTTIRKAEINKIDSKNLFYMIANFHQQIEFSSEICDKLYFNFDKSNIGNIVFSSPSLDKSG